MRCSFSGAGLITLLAATFLGPPSSAQPVTGETAIAAELTIDAADPRIGILFAGHATYAFREPVADSEAVQVETQPWAAEAGLVRRLWGRVRVRGASSSGTFRAIGRATPQFDLVNSSDSTIRLTGRVHIPDQSLPESPGAYLARAATEDGFSQYVRLDQEVSVLTGDLEGLGDEFFFARSETRPAGTPVGGPRAVETFGVPFSRPLVLYVPPSFREYERGDEVIVEIAPYGVRLVVAAEAVGVNGGGSASEPLLIDERKLDRNLPRPAGPTLSPFRLCRVSRAGASARAADAPVCTCLRDDVLRSQRCHFSFPDLLGEAELSAPLRAGETGNAVWRFHPVGAGSGTYEMRTTMFVNGKWVPVASSRLGALRLPYDAAHPIRGRVGFTAPAHPTMLRTTLRLWPLGAKQAIESTNDVFVALHKPKPRSMAHNSPR
jgi:hypothetical protein